MGNQNAAINYFLADNERFADLFNVAFFQGKQVVLAEDLSELDSKARLRDDREERETIFREYARDQLKRWKCGMNFLILGVEPESTVQYALPVKLMKYESIQYEKEYREISKKNRLNKNLSSKEYISGFSKSDCLSPMLTIALYHGLEEWDAPKSLREMVDYESIPEEIREDVRKHCNNFHVNFMDMNHMENADKFKTDLREVFGFLKRQNDKEALIDYVNQNERFRHLREETYDVILALSNTSKNIIRKEMQNTEEGIDMCLALQQLKEDAIREGRAEGKRLGWKEGRIQGRIQGQRQAVHSLNELNRKLLEEGRTEDLFRSLQDINYQKKMMKEYGIELAPLS